MIILTATAIALALVLVSVLMHYAILRRVSGFMQQPSIKGRTRMLIGVFGVIGAHCTAIALFALAYLALSHGTPIGGLAGDRGENAILDHLYFSMMSFTTLGVGDIYPTQGLRIISGFQALLGFVLIGWSASFTYVAMKKTWDETGDN